MKETKRHAQYEPVAKIYAHRCELCRHFQAPSACSIVAGLIMRGAWCHHWRSR